MEELKDELPVGSLYLNLIDVVDTGSLDNGVIIRIDNKWRSLSPDKFVRIMQKLNYHLEMLGYEEVRILDKNDTLIARDSKLGDQLIFFELASI